MGQHPAEHLQAGAGRTKGARAGDWQAEQAAGPTDPACRSGHKSRPSYAKLDRLLRIDPDDVRREGAILNEDRFNDVVGNLAKYHDLSGHGADLQAH
jgi:hypothetical protein